MRSKTGVYMHKFS